MRAFFALLLLASCCTGLPARAESIDFGHYRALVIGIDKYTHLKPLETATRGATALHELLQKRYGFHSTLLLNPTRDELVRALDRLREDLSEQDNLLIYYAGHGFLDRQTDEGFWLPANAEERSQVEWVPISTITRLLRATTAKHALVIADSCYSGTLTRDAGVSLPTGGERKAELARLSAKRARKALTSGGLEPVTDGGGDGQSVFTRALLDVLAENGQPIDGDALFRAVRRQVIVNARQTPEYADVRFAGDEGGDFIFVPTNGVPARAATTKTAALGNGDGFLSRSEIKQAIVGKTLRFANPQNGKIARLYFADHGKYEAVWEDNPSRIAQKLWWVTGHPALCRTHDKNDERTCQKLTYDDNGRKLVFHKMDGSPLFEAEVLEGRQFPGQ